MYTHIYYIDCFHGIFFTMVGSWRTLNQPAIYWLVNNTCVTWPFGLPVAMAKDTMENSLHYAWSDANVNIKHMKKKKLYIHVHVYHWCSYPYWERDHPQNWQESWLTWCQGRPAGPGQGWATWRSCRSQSRPSFVPDTPPGETGTPTYRYMYIQWKRCLLSGYHVRNLNG